MIAIKSSLLNNMLALRVFSLIVISYNLILSLVLCDDVTLRVTDQNLTITNGIIDVTFNHSNANVISLWKNGKNLVGTVTDKTFYLDWNAGGGKFLPSSFTIVKNTTEMVHIMYFQPNGHKRLQMEYHIAVFHNVSGFYQWVHAANTGNVTVKMSEFRIVYRLSKTMMPFISNMVRKGMSPTDLPGSPTIQDTTWRLTDGSYWSKYDYAGYIRETPWFGVYGGGVGAWVVTPSREYHSGGPLKQDLLTQHYGIMCNYLTSKHLGTLEFQGKPGWSKFYGPWLMFFNSGSEDKMLESVAKQAEIEKSLWPYSWLQDPAYPLKRGSLRGRVTGQPRAAVVLYDSFDEQFDLQTKGYLYNTESDEKGYFNITNIRPGKYILVLYPVAGQGSENLLKQNVTVLDGNNTVQDIYLPEPSGILWSIGQTNRRSDGFRYSDEPRNFYWQTLPPANLNFHIGKSNPTKDWYYAQTHNGTWNIIFNDRPDGHPRTLRIAIAAASGSLIFHIETAQLQVMVNNEVVGKYTYENEGAVYRGAMQSGKFYSEVIKVRAEQVKEGENVVSLKVLNGKFMYDAISYQNNRK